MRCRLCVAAVGVVLAALWGKALLPQPPAPSEPAKRSGPRPPSLFPQLRLPAPEAFATFNATVNFSLHHIMKTGGTTLQNHLAHNPIPRLDWSSCAAAAEPPAAPLRNDTAVSDNCRWWADFLEREVCKASCECCAPDEQFHGQGFHGTILRSPRAHTLSFFNHAHTVIRFSWSRCFEDLFICLVERLAVRATRACEAFVVEAIEAEPDLQRSLEEHLAVPPDARPGPVRAGELNNPQSHYLTCSKSRGSFGPKYRVLEGGVDSLAPPLDEALASVRRFEWVGITDLYEVSLCLLHYQANQTLPQSCNCDTSPEGARVSEWKDRRFKSRDPTALSPDTLAEIDAHTAVDAPVYVAALRLLLGRLRRLEELTGVAVLRCLDWHKLQRNTRYLPGLWDGPDGLLPEADADGKPESALSEAGQ